MWDAFVIGARNNGVYALVGTSNKCGEINFSSESGTVSGKKITIAFKNSSQVGYGSANIHYTTDGTDPRWSDTAKVYTAAVDNLPVGTVVKAAAEKTDASTPLYWSEVYSTTVAS